MIRFGLLAIDLVAVCLLVFGMYFPRHRRRDLVVAYLGVNVGVVAVASAISPIRTGGGLGFGLALFGVLSIIRLRSTELDQHEVAYYFSALALGLLAAIGGRSLLPALGLMAAVLGVMFVGDHPRLLRGYQRQVMVLDCAVVDQVTLVAHLERVLGARVHATRVERVDLVNDTTVVEVRYSRPAGAGVATVDRRHQPVARP